MTKDKISRSALSTIFNLVIFCCFILFMSSCETEEPEEENVEEMITKVTVNFIPTGGGNTISVSAIDPDGDGPQDMEPEGDVNLEYNLEYSLELEFENALESPPEDITLEILEEGDEHMIFFGWTGDVFFDPDNGDISSNREDIRYEDSDDNGFPIGLETLWTTNMEESEGSFRIVLKHQPDLKTATSGVSTGATDVDVSFNIVVAK